jgi:hypothetical protein
VSLSARISFKLVTCVSVARNGNFPLLCHTGMMALPKFDYYLDESDPDILVLRRQDSVFVAAFSSQGATKEGIREAAEKDYSRVIQEITQETRVEVYHRR